MAGQSTRRTVGVTGAVLVVVAVALAVWFVTRPEPAQVSLEDAVADVAGDASEDVASEAADGQAADGQAADGQAADGATDDGDATATAASADGAWAVDTSVGTFDVVEATGTFVGFRVDEELANVGATTAVGRTPAVDGSVAIDGTTLTEAAFTADLTQIVSDRPRRDDRIQDALETGEFPEATFTLTEPVELEGDPTAGETVSVTAPGELTIHGVTQQVEVPLEAALVDDLVVVTGALDIALADYDVEAPTAPIVLGVSDTATVELQLYLAKEA